MRKLVAPFARQRPAGANPHKEAAIWNVEVDQAVHSLPNARKTLLVLQLLNETKFAGAQWPRCADQGQASDIRRIAATWQGQAAPQETSHYMLCFRAMVFDG